MIYVFHTYEEVHFKELAHVIAVANKPESYFQQAGNSGRISMLQS